MRRLAYTFNAVQPRGRVAAEIMIVRRIAWRAGYGPLGWLYCRDVRTQGLPSSCKRGPHGRDLTLALDWPERSARPAATPIPFLRYRVQKDFTYRPRGGLFLKSESGRLPRVRRARVEFEQQHAEPRVADRPLGSRTPSVHFGTSVGAKAPQSIRRVGRGLGLRLSGSPSLCLRQLRGPCRNRGRNRPVRPKRDRPAGAREQERGDRCTSQRTPSLGTNIE